ncbi:MAG TPA: sigma 54-interacting transcriptional regulator [Polyangium sp.]|nr:sigma 54-interacting transcriptional regulator [Polyangium sp.]
MSNQFKLLPTDREDPDVAPCLLCAFPKLVAFPIPRMEEVVGRAWLDDAGIVDGVTSREHISFSRTGSRLHIKDHRSQNGTFVDAIRLEPEVETRIDDGAIIRIGQTIFVYRERFPLKNAPEPPLGELVAPWGFRQIRQDLFARTYRPGLNVLLDGRIGTGKESLAKEVAQILRPGTKFVPVNLATIPRDHYEATLFGWEQNTFTGAFRKNEGFLRSAANGTVFLDEIEALPVDLRPKLLRFLDQRESQAVGSRAGPQSTDCLVIAATNHSPEELLAKDAFRADLLARFQLRLKLPALNDRPEDLFAIIASRWQRVHGNLEQNIPRVDAEAIERLMLQDWPDDVRGLFRFLDSLAPRTGLTKSALYKLKPIETPAPPSKRGTGEDR